MPASIPLLPRARVRRFAAVSAIGATMLLGACGSSTSNETATTVAPTTDDASSSTTTPNNVSATSTPAAGKANANTASHDELAAALTAAGVDNAERWAREIDEYRPYPTDDPTFAKLRGELEKYGPSKETVDLIVSALSL
jgi:hypothetical protein